MFSCKLQAILHFLSAAAVGLGLLLLLTVAGAIWLYRRTRDTDPLDR